jgi:predicted TIM-barrel enzyme
VGINTLMNGPEVGVAIPAHVAQEFVRSVTGGQAPDRTNSGATVSV